MNCKQTALSSEKTRNALQIMQQTTHNRVVVEPIPHGVCVYPPGSGHLGLVQSIVGLLRVLTWRDGDLIPSLLFTGNLEERYAPSSRTAFWSVYGECRV